MAGKQDPASSEENTGKGCLALIGKFLLALVLCFAAAVALGVFLFWWNTRPVELQPGAAYEYIRLESGDTVLHAYSGLRWLDSQRYFVVQADPAGFEDRIARSSGTARIVYGSGRELWNSGSAEKLPDWWDVETVSAGVGVDVGSSGSPHNGEYRIYAKERGLIYIVDR